MKKTVYYILLCSIAFTLSACSTNNQGKEETSYVPLIQLEEKGTTETKEEPTVQPSSTEQLTSEETTKPEITVVSNPESAKEVTQETVKAYYEDGTEEILTKEADGTFLTAKGALYYLGEDGVYRNRDYADLYATNPQAIKPVTETVTAYYEDGAEEVLTKEEDGTFLTLKGARYYLGDDGVYRCKGYADLYATKPQAIRPQEGTVTAFYEDGAEEILTKEEDGTFLNGKGARYYLGDDGVYRCKGYADLYVQKPE